MLAIQEGKGERSLRQELQAWSQEGGEDSSF